MRPSRAQDYASAASAVLRAVSDAYDLFAKIDTVTVSVTDDTIAKINDLSRLTVAVTSAIGDTGAELIAAHPEGWADQVKAFTDAAGPAIQSESDMLSFVTDLLQSPGIENSQALQDKITSLKFLMEHLALSIGDTASFIASQRPDGWGDVMKSFGDNVTPAIQAESTMLSFVVGLLATDAPVIANSQAMRDQITNMKFLVEHLALSMGDTAAIIALSRPEDFNAEDAGLFQRGGSGDSG